MRVSNVAVSYHNTAPLKIKNHCSSYVLMLPFKLLFELKMRFAMKKISLALMILCSSTAALANSGQATIFNTSTDGYMTVFYKICHVTQNQRTCEPTQSMTLMSAKWGQNYKVINVPVQADYDEVSIENV